MALHTSIQCGYGVLNTGTTFGDNTSPSNFDPFGLARRVLSAWLWLHDPHVKDRTLPFLPPIQMDPPPSAAEIAKFTPADPNSRHTGVLDDNGNRLPPPYNMHVDDNMYADVSTFLVQTVAASAAGLFDLLGWPDDKRVPPPLSYDKLETVYNHSRKAVGRQFNSRRLTVGMPPYKRERCSVCLAEKQQPRRDATLNT